jgi:hypothetical protein
MSSSNIVATEKPVCPDLENKIDSLIFEVNGALIKKLRQPKAAALPT